MFRFEPDGFKQLPNAVFQLIVADFNLLDFINLRKAAKGRIPGIEGRVGVLENHLHPAPQFSQLHFVQLADILIVEENPAGRGLDQA